MTPPGDHQPDDADVDRLAALLEDIDDLTTYGTRPVGAGGQWTVPKKVRMQLGLEGATGYDLYGSPRYGVLIVARAPSTPQEGLLRHVRARLAEQPTAEPSSEDEREDRENGDPDGSS